MQRFVKRSREPSVLYGLLQSGLWSCCLTKLLHGKSNANLWILAVTGLLCTSCSALHAWSCKGCHGTYRHSCLAYLLGTFQTGKGCEDGATTVKAFRPKLPAAPTSAGPVHCVTRVNKCVRDSWWFMKLQAARHGTHTWSAKWRLYGASHLGEHLIQSLWRMSVKDVCEGCLWRMSVKDVCEGCLWRTSDPQDWFLLCSLWQPIPIVNFLPSQLCLSKGCALVATGATKATCHNKLHTKFFLIFKGYEHQHDSRIYPAWTKLCVGSVYSGFLKDQKQ